VIVTLALLIGVLYAVGSYLILQRSLSRIVIGLAMLGHGANLLLLAAGGPAGNVPIAGSDPATTADPLPQALALTAIVITFGVSGFLLAMSYRSWRQRRDDVVEDDIEDRRIARARALLDLSDEERAARADAEANGPSSAEHGEGAP
jgi:multicomponent Na+:H+ antiporter subunit C